MAAAKKYSVEQIVAKLREHEKLQEQGLTIPQACKRIGISDQTFYRWRLKYARSRPSSSTTTTTIAVTAASACRHQFRSLRPGTVGSLSEQFWANSTMSTRERLEPH